MVVLVCSELRCGVQKDLHVLHCRLAVILFAILAFCREEKVYLGALYLHRAV